MMVAVNTPMHGHGAGYSASAALPNARQSRKRRLSIRGQASPSQTGLLY